MMSNSEQAILEFFQREMEEITRGDRQATNIVIAPYEVVREFGLELEQDEEDSEVYRVVNCVPQALSNEGMTLNVVKDSDSELEAKP